MIQCFSGHIYFTFFSQTLIELTSFIHQFHMGLLELLWRIVCLFFLISLTNVWCACCPTQPPIIIIIIIILRAVAAVAAAGERRVCEIIRYCGGGGGVQRCFLAEREGVCVFVFLAMGGSFGGSFVSLGLDTHPFLCLLQSRLREFSAQLCFFVFFWWVVMAIGSQPASQPAPKKR